MLQAVERLLENIFLEDLGFHQKKEKITEIRKYRILNPLEPSGR